MGMSLQEHLDLDVTTLKPTGYQQVVVQQSVTMLAYMEKSRNNTALTEVPGGPRVLLGFSIHDLPILIGAAAGAVGLTIIILVAVIVWHCCRGSSNREKAYSVEEIERGSHGKHLQPTIVHRGSQNNAPVPNNHDQLCPNDMVVYIGDKPSQLYETQVMESQQSASKMRRSSSLPFNDEKPIVRAKGTPKSRPTSQPFSLANEKRKQDGEYGLPSIPECLSRGRRLHVPQISQCASYSALDEPSNCYAQSIDPNASLKTRSLPAWGRLRPLSTEDDLNELYAKVNFSKKRKNRMGNDSAAAIAMNKSTPNYSSAPFAHKDTDSLVENEAVVVYDERTSL